jgi:prolyl oligopeptidase
LSDDVAANRKPPLTRREDVRETIHGIEVADPYRWLEDGASAETRAWIASQQAFTAAYLNSPGRQRIRARLAELMKVDSTGIPIERAGSYFFARRRADQQRGAIFRRRGLHGADELLIDSNALSSDRMTGAFIAGISHDGAMLAYGVRRGGEDEFEIRVLDVERRADLPDLLPRSRRYGGAAWRHDGTGFYYPLHTDDGPRLRFHRIGAAAADDSTVFGANLGRGHFAGAYVASNGRHLVIVAGSGSTNERTEIHVQRLNPDGEIAPIVTGVDASFIAVDAGDALMLLTNWNAPNFRVLRVDLANPATDAWHEIIPEGGAVIESLSAIGGKLVVTTLEDVRPRVRVYEPDGKFVREVQMPGRGTVGWPAGRWERSEAFVHFSAFNVAPTILRCDVETGASESWWREQTNVDLERFEQQQVWFNSRDGTRVPMFLFHRRGLALDGSNPTLLGGYGGFRLSMTAGYSPFAIAWAEAGGVCAFANLRGGGEFGEAWHQAGRLEKKQNVFDDFIAAAEWLIANRYTSPARLATSGGSNGGLLVGAALTQRPELFRAVVCSRPVLDMVRLFKSPLAALWTPEYGSPADPAQFRYMLAYSPYHNVRAGVAYPAVMLPTGDSDTRCDPMHARKMTAMLQAASTSGHPILLEYREEAGHIAGLPIDATIDEVADQLYFLARELGMIAD